MSKSDLKSSLAVLLILVAGSALAGEIYKWTDDAGNVHYEDRPLGEEVEVLKIRSKPTSEESVQEEVDSVGSTQEKLQAKHEERAKADASKMDQRKKRAADEERCTEYKTRQESLETSRRFYREDASGERTYLDEQQMQEVRDQVQASIKEFCKP